MKQQERPSNYQVMRQQGHHQRLKPMKIGSQQQHPSFNCPRCGSHDTKFCYYNNKNVSQPRYLCKTCKRHWTQGGTQRNIPIGGNGHRGNHLRTYAFLRNSLLYPPILLQPREQPNIAMVAPRNMNAFPPTRFEVFGDMPNPRTQEGFIGQTRLTNSSHLNDNRRFTNYANIVVSDSILQSINTSIADENNSSISTSSSFDIDEWLDLSGYDTFEVSTSRCSA